MFYFGTKCKVREKQLLFFVLYAHRELQMTKVHIYKPGESGFHFRVICAAGQSGTTGTHITRRLLLHIIGQSRYSAS